MSSPNAIGYYRQPGAPNDAVVLFDPAAQFGNVWWVNNANAAASDTTGFGRTPNAPFATLNFALNSANNTGLTANNGDMVYVGPGHIETVTAAAGTTPGTSGFTANVAGVTVVGLGTGRARPQITFGTATTAQVLVSAANFCIKNIVFTHTLDAIAAAVKVTGTDFFMQGCEWDINTGTTGIVKGILTAATADRFRVEDTRFIGPATNTGTTVTACIDHEVGVNFLIRNCDFHGKMTQAITNATTVLGGIIDHCRFETYTGTKSINLASATTCFITDCDFNVPSGSAPVVGAAAFVARNAYSAAAGVTAGSALTW